MRRDVRTVQPGHSDGCESGFDDLTTAQAWVEARVGNGGTRLTDLAEQARITKQSTGQLVDRRERLGYVERVPDPTDARARLIRLAPRGRAAQRRARGVEREIDAGWERHLGRSRRGDLRGALPAHREITDPWA